MKALIALSLALALLQGCSTLPEEEPLASRTPWQQFLIEQQQQTRWTLQGKLGIRHDQHNTSANLSWWQQDRRYRLHLSGPLGQGSVTIEGEPGFVELAVSGEGRYQADSPEALLYEHLGWEMPLASLPYWVRGIPAPNQAYQARFTDQQRLQELIQEGWRVEYTRYRQFAEGYLPQRMILNQPGLKVTLVIKEWLPSSDR